jgi:leucine efflux protein
MLGTVNLPTFAVGAVLIVLLPGPNSLYVLSVAARKGVRTGYRAACGVFLGDTTLFTLTALGAASMLKRSPTVFDAVKFLGAIYLAWLGFGMLRSAVRMFRERRRSAAAHGEGDLASSATATAATEAIERPFRRALVISLLNPKAILFILAFLTQFVDPDAPHPVTAFALLALIVQACSVTYLSILIFSGHKLAAGFRRRRRLSASMTGGVGSLFVGFAVKLATASLG